MYAWTDAEMLSKTVESMPKEGHSTSFMQPSEHSKLTRHLVDMKRFSSIQPSSQRRTSVAPLHLFGPSSGNGTNFSTIPCKAQRLMGVGMEMPVFQKSSFIDSDDEEIAAVPVKGWAGITNRSKSEPRALFLSGVRRMSRSESQTGTTTAKSHSIDQGTLQSQEGALHLDATGSRWSSLGNRLRNSSVAPTKLRIKKCASSPPPAPVPSSKRSSEPSIQLITTAAHATSPVRISSRQSTPKRASFPSDVDRMSLSDDRRSPSHRMSYTGWDNARVSSQALRQSIEPAARSNVHYEKLAEYKMRRAQMVQPSLTSTRRDSVAVSHAPPMSNAASSQPLSFDVSRRPRAPFPPSTDYFASSSSALLDGHCQPQLPQSDLPPGPSRMSVPSQMTRQMSDMPDKASRHLLSRPSRTSDRGCDIFSEAANSFAARVPITVMTKESPAKQRQAKAIPPRRQPPPTGPVPPLPTVHPSKGPQTLRGMLVAEAWARDVDTHRLSLLERRAKTAKEKKAQADAALLKKRLSEVACKFAKDAMTETFTASLSINTCQSLCQQTQIDLVVGGILFQTCFAEICKTEGVATSGLVAWLKKWACVSARSPSSKPNMHTAVVHSAKRHRNSGQETKGTSSYPSSFDSEEDDEKDIEDERQEENFEELHSANSLEYEMCTLQRLRCRSTEHALEKCIESISQHVKEPRQQLAHLTAAIPRRAPSHAHTPTSVSIDAEGGEGSEEGEEVSIGLSSTPDLIHSHAFVFTKTCSSSPPSSSWVPTDDDGSNGGKKARPSNNFLEVHLERNPQLYSTVLHLLKHETLPLYYTSDSFPSMDRRRGLLAVQRECSWLGYSALVQICEDALTSL